MISREDFIKLRESNLVVDLGLSYYENGYCTFEQALMTIIIYLGKSTNELFDENTKLQQQPLRPPGCFNKPGECKMNKCTYRKRCNRSDTAFFDNHGAGYVIKIRESNWYIGICGSTARIAKDASRFTKAGAIKWIKKSIEPGRYVIEPITLQF